MLHRLNKSLVSLQALHDIAWGVPGPEVVAKAALAAQTNGRWAHKVFVPPRCALTVIIVVTLMIIVIVITLIFSALMYTNTYGVLWLCYFFFCIRIMEHNNTPHTHTHTYTTHTQAPG